MSTRLKNSTIQDLEEDADNNFGVSKYFEIEKMKVKESKHLASID